MLSTLRKLPIQFRHSLRARVALWVALPLFLTLAGASLFHNWRERQLMEEQFRVTAVQVGQVITGSLRYAMLTEDRAMLNSSLQDVGSMDGISRIEIMDLSGQVRADSANTAIGEAHLPTDPGCVECHRFPAASRPQSVVLTSAGGMLRVASAIANEPACQQCHASGTSHLGMLLVDIPTVSINRRLAQDLQITMLLSAVMTLLVTIGVYLLVDFSVVRRVAAIRRPLAQYAGGDFSSRLPATGVAADEFDDLALAFNRMADELERHTKEQNERAAVRQRAIMEERERIARELHDGLAQLLGYVNTKAMAVRLLLKNRQSEAAEKQLLQVEEAAREMFVDVREAIAGLRMNGRADADLATMINDYALQFTRLSDLPVNVTIAPEARGTPIAAEAELQMLRIVQEALANVRKHAAASEARIDMRREGRMLVLAIADNGRGFDPAHIHTNHRPRFGLSTMRERADAVGAEFQLDSNPGSGTCVTVRLPLQEN